MKKLTFSLISILFVFQITIGQTKPQGTGSSESPFQISTPDELLWLGLNQNVWDKTIIIQNNIDLSVSGSWDNGKGFAPIGDKYTPFTGEFNGNNKSISGLTINRPDSSYIALIGFTGQGATIKNVKVENVDIKGYFTVGSLIGLVDSLAVISNCSASGNVEGEKNVGGLAGWNKGTIKSGSANVTVYANGKWCGGFIGINEGTVTSAGASGNLSGKGGAIGGFAGMNQENGIIRECFASGNADGIDDAPGVGGFVGINKGEINVCYATGKAGGASIVGGFAGASLSGAEFAFCFTNGSVNNVSTIAKSTGGFIGTCAMSKVHNCYSTASISASGGYAGYGGFAGTAVLADIKSCFFDTKKARAKNSIGNGKSNKGITGLKTKHFARKEKFEGWQFSGDNNNPWTFPANANAPKLYWQE